MKVCNRCGIAKQDSEFTKFRNKLPSGKISEGLRKTCNECKNANARINQARVDARCPSCGVDVRVLESTFAKTGGLCPSCSTAKYIAEKGHPLQKRPGRKINDEPAYHRWIKMKTRCSGIGVSSNTKRRYADRGITVCDKWINDSWAFVDWANANGFSPELSLDRIDNDAGYSPENCRWVNMAVQSRNKSKTRRIQFSDGRSFCCIHDAAVAIGVNDGNIHRALKRGIKVNGLSVSVVD